jgi:predicted transposase YdaD
MATNQLSGYSPFVVEVASVLEGEYKKGEEKGIYKVVSRMLKNNLPLPTIMTSTDLSESEIRQFARQQGLTVTK